MDVMYLGMPLQVDEAEHAEYFAHCARHQFHLQACEGCGRLRYPPTTACPFCMHPGGRWTPVEGRGTVFSYVEVHHAIQPAFKPFLPYLVLLVDLDVQRDIPAPGDALRVAGNLVLPDGGLAPADAVARVGIGSRVRMVFSDVSHGLSLPQWTLDESAPQPQQPWRAAT